jgi:hypothetical protein
VTQWQDLRCPLVIDRSLGDRTHGWSGDPASRFVPCKWLVAFREGSAWDFELYPNARIEGDGGRPGQFREGSHDWALGLLREHQNRDHDMGDLVAAETRTALSASRLTPDLTPDARNSADPDRTEPNGNAKE